VTMITRRSIKVIINEKYMIILPQIRGRAVAIRNTFKNRRMTRTNMVFHMLVEFNEFYMVSVIVLVFPFPPYPLLHF